jgi:hypothetical protein
LPIKILRPDHTELVGSGCVLLTAPHASDPKTSFHTGQIVEDVALASRAYAVIGKVNSAYSEDDRLNSAREDLRKTITEIIQENSIKCVLEILGRQEPGVEIGTGHGMTCSVEIRDLLSSFLSRTFKVELDDPAHDPKAEVGQGSREATGALAVQSAQIIVGSEEREKRRDILVDRLAELVGIINVKLGFDPSAEPPHSED